MTETQTQISIPPPPNKPPTQIGVLDPLPELPILEKNPRKKTKKPMKRR